MTEQNPSEKDGLPAGTVIANKYIIEDGPVVGRGAWSVVKGCAPMSSYNPPGSRPGMKFVVKILEKNYLISLTEGDVDRAMVEVKLEIETLRHIPAHDNVVTFIESIETDGHFFLVFERVSCGDLCDLILQDPAGKLSEERSKKYVLQLISAVLHCHVHDIIHRDIKPENLLVNDDDVLKLTDFGLAKRVRSFNSSYHHSGGLQGNGGCRNSSSGSGGGIYPTLMGSYNPSSHDPLDLHALLVPYVGCERLIGKRVECSDVIGTPRYGAPEMFYAKFTKTHYDGFAADTWAIGVVTYILLSGKFPYSSSSGSAASDEEMFHTITDYALVLPTEISPLAEDFIQCLLQKDPNERMPLYATLYHPWLASVAPTRGSVVARQIRSSSATAVGGLVKSSELHEMCDRFDAEAQQLHRCIAQLQYELYKAREGQMMPSYGAREKKKECDYDEGSFAAPVRTSKSSSSISVQAQHPRQQQQPNKSGVPVHATTPGRSSRRTLTPGRASSNMAALSPPHRSRSVMGGHSSHTSHLAPPSSSSINTPHKGPYHHNGLSSSSRSGSSSAAAAGRDGLRGGRLSTARSPASRLRVTSPIRAGLYGVRMTAGLTNSTHRSSSSSGNGGGGGGSATRGLSAASAGGGGAMAPGSVIRGHLSGAATRSRLYQSPMHREESNNPAHHTTSQRHSTSHSSAPDGRSRSSSAHTSRNNYLRHGMMMPNRSSSTKRTGGTSELALNELAGGDAALLARRRLGLGLRTKSPLTRSAGGAAVRRGTPLRAGMMSTTPMHTDRSSSYSPSAAAAAARTSSSARRSSSAVRRATAAAAEGGGGGGGGGTNSTDRWTASEETVAHHGRSGENGTRGDRAHYRHHHGSSSHYTDSQSECGGCVPPSHYDAAHVRDRRVTTNTVAAAATGVRELRTASTTSHGRGNSENSYPDYANNSHSRNTVNPGNPMAARSRSNSVRHIMTTEMNSDHDPAHGLVTDKTLLSPLRTNNTNNNNSSHSGRNEINLDRNNNSMNSGSTRHPRSSSVCSTRSTAAAAEAAGRGVTPTRGTPTRRIRGTVEASVLGDGAVRGDRGSNSVSSRLNGGAATGSSSGYHGRVGNDLHINDPVTYKGYRAIVRFNGPVTFGAGVWVGLEMLEGNEGTNNGYSFIDKKQYFTCPKGKGVFVRASQVRKL